MPYTLIMICCVLDHLLTAWNISRGGNEANPVMAVVMAQPLWVSFIIKNGWTALMLAALYLLSKKVPATKWALHGMVAVYLGVIGYHLWGIASTAVNGSIIKTVVLSF